MPQTQDKLEYLGSLIKKRHPLLDGAFGSIDGLSLPVQESDDPEIENATYNGWKSSHFISNVLVFSPEGMEFDSSHHSMCDYSYFMLQGV